MKIALILCIIALAGVLGYLAEPSLRPIVTGRPADTEATKTSQEGDADVIVIKTPDINPNDYAPEQLPKTLKITYPTRFVMESSGLTVNMDVGTTVRLIRLEDNRVIVSPGDTNFKVPLPVSNTDLLDQLAGIIPIPPSERKQPVAPPITITPADTIASTDGETTELPGDDSEETVTEPVVDDTTDDAIAEKAPEKSEEHLPPPAKSDVVAIMKNSIMEGQLKEFTFEQVTDWTAGENETVDGLEFATGTVTYTTETLFGKKTIDAKAYISGKKVARWIWPKSGIELE